MEYRNPLVYLAKLRYGGPVFFELQNVMFQEPHCAVTQGRSHDAGSVSGRVFAALDLGTNNCRLLVAAPDTDAANAANAAAGPDDGKTANTKSSPRLRVLDSFSRVVRLGEGVSATGVLAPEAMERTLAALRQCEKKLAKYQIADARFVATEACRRAGNSQEFMARVLAETGLRIDIISSEEEARLAFLGCASLLTKGSQRAIVFDIGGGSTELMWVDVERHARGEKAGHISGWLSIGYGVMNLADKYGGPGFADLAFGDMVEALLVRLRPFNEQNRISETLGDSSVQMLSTSGTVTTLAAIHLDLPRYDRTRIDGIRLKVSDIRATTQRLLAMRPSERFHHPCIGPDRADFIISGCAIFEAISSLWPTGEITIADRGVREGIIVSLMSSHAW